MKCPCCGLMMDEGTIEHERGIAAWAPVGSKKPFFFPAIMGKSLIICNPSEGPLAGSVVHANLCVKCKMIFIDVSEFVS